MPQDAPPSTRRTMKRYGQDTDQVRHWASAARSSAVEAPGARLDHVLLSQASLPDSHGGRVPASVAVTSLQPSCPSRVAAGAALERRGSASPPLEVTGGESDS